MPLRVTTGVLVLPLLLSGAAAPPEPCRVTGVTTSAGDVSRAMDACVAARARFAELFDGPVPHVRIQLTERTGYRIGADEHGAAVLWPTSATLAASMDEAQVEVQWREVLPHETAHALLTARFFPDMYIPQGEYGTPLPDWLDEGVAIWAEPAASRDERIAQARALPAARQGLAGILGSRHPAMANAAAWRMREGGAPPADDEALWAFYPQSIGVVAFVMDTGGAAAMAALAERVLARPGRQGMQVLAGLPGMPADEQGVLDAWGRWLGAAPGRR